MVHKTAKLILFCFFCTCEKDRSLEGTFTWWPGEPFYEGFQVCHDIKEAKCFYIYNNFPSPPLIANTLLLLADNISVISSFHPN